eukprot:15480865-Alexandrium_andersonii.AAC.1
MEASHRDNWLSVNGVDDVISYAQGSIPGDPWADLFFGLIHTRVMAAIRQRLAEKGLLVQVSASGPYPLPVPAPCEVHNLTDVSFVDDSALPVIAPSPAELLVRLARVASIVDDAMTQHALFLNYAVNKTAAVVAFR